MTATHTPFAGGMLLTAILPRYGEDEELTEEIKARGPVRDDDMSIAAHLRRLKDPKGKPLPDDLLAAEVGVYFAAGIESAGNAMSWTL